jgi:hypothetical protein
MELDVIELSEHLGQYRSPRRSGRIDDLLGGSGQS